MAIPDYETLMLPLLKQAKTGEEVSIRDCVQALATEFRLTDEERNDALSNGTPRFTSRVHWARAYLIQAKLLESTRRGHFKITSRGQSVLARRLTRIDNKLLLEFPEFQDFKVRRRAANGEVEPESDGTKAPSPIPTPDHATPEELIDSAHQEITTALKAALLQQILDGTPAFFERVILDLLIAMGYGGSRVEAAKRVGRTGDGGIDGTINEDLLGLDIVYLQAKRYTPGNVVGVSQVREFAGALVEKGASKGVFVTTSHFAAGAEAYAQRIPQRLVLINGAELTRLMVEFGVGVRVERKVEIKRLDLDYFDVDQSL